MTDEEADVTDEEADLTEEEAHLTRILGSQTNGSGAAEPVRLVRFWPDHFLWIIGGKIIIYEHARAFANGRVGKNCSRPESKNGRGYCSTSCPNYPVLSPSYICISQTCLEENSSSILQSFFVSNLVMVAL